MRCALDLANTTVHTYNTRPAAGRSAPFVTVRSVAQSGRAPSSGGGGRRFKSGHSDQSNGPPAHSTLLLSLYSVRPQDGVVIVGSLLPNADLGCAAECPA